LVILSGGPSGTREYAGVGFLVAPYARNWVAAFREHTDRIASISLRVPGGKILLVSIYAPHGGRGYYERQSFFDELGTFLEKSSSHGPKYIFGNFNARIHSRSKAEKHITGPYFYGNPNAESDPQSNANFSFNVARHTA